jgi:hypothetical protein
MTKAQLAVLFGEVLQVTQVEVALASGEAPHKDRIGGGIELHCSR